MELYLLLALAAINLILLVVLLVTVRRTPGGDTEISKSLAVNASKLDELGKKLSEEADRSRRETQVLLADTRKETAEGLRVMNEKIAAMTLANTEHQGKLNAAVAESLGAIRLNLAEQNEKQSRVIRESVDKMLESNEKKLEQMRVTVDEKLSATLTQRLDSSFKTVSEQLENVYKSLGEMRELSNGVTANVTTLNRVLTNVKARGTWAEVQLGTILDQTIPNMYVTNYSSDPSSRDRVEFAIRIPAGDGSSQDAYLPVDSKFPMEDYIRLCTAADSADAASLELARKALEDRVLKEAKDVSKYINVPSTTPFAILYLATEGLYAEVLSSKRGIAEKIQTEFNVMLAGPATITALLNSLSMGFRTVAINEKANEVRMLLAAAKVQYDKFGVVLDKARRKIDEAGKSLDEAQHRNSIIRNKLKGVEAIESGQANEMLGIEDNNDLTDTFSDYKEDI